MLVLTRKAKPKEGQQVAKDESGVLLINNSSEPITITLQPGESLGTVEVLRILGNTVKLGLSFPRDLTVIRSELPIRTQSAESEPVAS